MNTITQAASQSTCEKRVTVCVLLDANDTVLACESNQCQTPCQRLSQVTSKSSYPTATCDTDHAELRALRALKPGDRPVRSVLYGHAFYCESCEQALRACGVGTLELGPPWEGCGLRQLKVETAYELARQWLLKTLADHTPRSVDELHAQARAENQPFGATTINWTLWTLVSSNALRILPDYRIQLS